VTAVYDEHGALHGYAKVVRDMTERRRLEELEKSSRRMNEFLAMLGHELRNPLAPIRNSVSILQLEPLSTPTMKGCRDVIDRQLTHLTRLVDDLLDVGRVTTGKITLRRERIALADVVARSVEASRALIDSRGHRLDVELPTQPVYVDGDMTRLVQVFHNLLNNAAKFTPNGGCIAVTATDESGVATVRVSDTGMGIGVNALPRVFELFAQERERIDPGQSGLGIGLTVVRSIVEMHNGTVEAASEGEVAAQSSSCGCRSRAVRPSAHPASGRRASAPASGCACSSSTTTATRPKPSPCSCARWDTTRGTRTRRGARSRLRASSSPTSRCSTSRCRA
jgi:signal transduction histidine kinase